jgi:hypothetical protein
MRLRTIFLVGHAALLLMVWLAYVVSHGGMAGDYVFIPGNDVVTSIADYGQVLFNRWQFKPSEESWAVQGFFYLNVPSFACGTWITVFLFRFIGDLDIAFPFGLSLYSYCFLVALPLTFIQWYWIGRLAERLKSDWKRRSDRG